MSATGPPADTAAAPVGFALPGVLAIAAGAALGVLERVAEAAFEPILCTEVCGFSAPGLLAGLAARRPGVPLGTAILPLGSRSDATMAMAATTIAHIAGAPFLLGVGTSSPQITTDWHGAAYDPRLAATRARLDAVRGVLDGGRRGSFRLPVTPGRDVRLLLAALGPRMTALAFEAADGVILNHTPPARVPEAPPDAHVLAFVWVMATDDPTHVRRDLATYMMAPPYARHFVRLGFGAVVDGVRALAADGRLREAPAAVPTEMVDTFSVDLDGLADRCTAYRAAGAVPVIIPVTGDDPVGEIDRLLRGGAWTPPARSGSDAAS